MDNSNSRIVILPADGNKEKSHKLTWGRYGHYVNLYKYWILGITLVGAIGGYFLGEYGYNRNKRTVSGNVSFDLALKKTKDGSSTYFDGTPFVVQDVVSLENIERAVKSSDDFASLSAESLYQNQAVSISEALDSADKVIADRYVLSAKSKYFSGTGEAQHFLFALGDAIKEKANDILSHYELPQYLPSSMESFTAFSLAERSEDLYNEYLNIKNTYRDLIQHFDGSLQVDNKSLFDYERAFDEKYGNNLLLSYTGIEKKRQYVSFDGTKEAAKSLLENYESQAIGYLNTYNTLTLKKDNAESRLNKLTSVDKPGESVSDAIVRYTDEIAGYQNEMNQIESDLSLIGYTISSATLSPLPDSGYRYWLSTYMNHYQDDSADWKKVQEWYTEGKAFSALINGCYDDLNSAHEEVTTVYRKAYQENTNSLTYYGVNVKAGKLSSPVIAVLVAVVAYLFSSLIFAGYGLAKENAALNHNSSIEKEDKPKETIDSEPKENDTNPQQDKKIPKDR